MLFIFKLSFEERLYSLAAFALNSIITSTLLIPTYEPEGPNRELRKQADES